MLCWEGYRCTDCLITALISYCMCACILSCFCRVRLFVTLWTVTLQALCPQDSPGENTRVGSHALLQGIFLTQGLNPCLLPHPWQPHCLHGFAFYRMSYVCMHAKSFQLCLTPCNPMDCSPPGCPVHGDSPSKNTGVGCHALLQGIFLIQGSNPHLLCLLLWQAGSLPLAPLGKSRMSYTWTHLARSLFRSPSFP